MKGLFIVFHGFSDHSGISKKIAYQCDALRHCGAEVELCYLDIQPDGTQRRMVGDNPIRVYGNGRLAKITKRICLGDITRYVRDHQIDFLYIRHDFNASPVTEWWLRQVRKTGVRIALEIPTYPYDAEFSRAKLLSNRIKLRVDQIFRNRMARSIDRIVTFSDDDTIFGRPTIRISNGIDFARIPLKTQVNDTRHEVHLLAVANIHFWHGFDRVIEGLRSYYATKPERIVRLRIVGDGSAREIAEYKRMISEYGLGQFVTLLGPRSGAELDELFAWCDMGIASLGRHRSGIERIKTLKNREYAARGIPFVYSETDEDFESMPYILKASADDSPIDIDALLAFYDSVRLAPGEIRASIEGTLSWDKQMEQVLAQLFKS